MTRVKVKVGKRKAKVRVNWNYKGRNTEKVLKKKQKKVLKALGL